VRLAAWNALTALPRRRQSEVHRHAERRIWGGRVRVDGGMGRPAL